MVRTTQQRTSIYNALVNSGRPLSVNEVFELAKNNVAGLGIATVYRNLKALQEEGRVIQVDLPGQAPRWEIAPESHHHHFLCNTCDSLFEIQGCPEGMAELLPKGYTLEEHDILLRGQCGVCAHKANAGVNRSTSR